MEQDGAGPRPPRVGLERARRHLEGKLAGSVSLDELARVAGLSKFHLGRAFKAAYGLPPRAYHIRLRVERARALLAEGRTVREAAAAVGFAGPTHLHRHFLRLTGQTPGRCHRADRHDAQDR